MTLELGGPVWILTYTRLEHVDETHLPSGSKAVVLSGTQSQKKLFSGSKLFKRPCH